MTPSLSPSFNELQTLHVSRGSFQLLLCPELYKAGATLLEELDQSLNSTQRLPHHSNFVAQGRIAICDNMPKLVGKEIGSTGYGLMGEYPVAVQLEVFANSC
jgi:hypothetical protein